MVTQRVITESRGANHSVDVIQSLGSSIEALRRELPALIGRLWTR